jgi:hypothetical protein
MNHSKTFSKVIHYNTSHLQAPKRDALYFHGKESEEARMKTCSVPYLPVVITVSFTQSQGEIVIGRRSTVANKWFIQMAAGHNSEFSATTANNASIHNSRGCCRNQEE